MGCPAKFQNEQVGGRERQTPYTHYPKNIRSLQQLRALTAEHPQRKTPATPLHCPSQKEGGRDHLMTRLREKEE